MGAKTNLDKFERAFHKIKIKITNHHFSDPGFHFCDITVYVIDRFTVRAVDRIAN